MKRQIIICTLCFLVSWILYGVGGGEEEAKVLLHKFLQTGADYLTLTEQLKPTKEDFKAYFDDDSWETAMLNYRKLWNKFPGFIKPNPGQTDLLLWKISSDELKLGKSAAVREFPGGYAVAAEHIRPGITIYRFKFVKPGKDIGMAFDGLTYINGHWVIFPKPWRVLQ